MLISLKNMKILIDVLTETTKTNVDDMTWSSLVDEKHQAEELLTEKEVKDDIGTV
jgi:hypothetical protein